MDVIIERAHEGPAEKRRSQYVPARESEHPPSKMGIGGVTLEISMFRVFSLWDLKLRASGVMRHHARVRRRLQGTPLLQILCLAHPFKKIGFPVNTSLFSTGLT